jgi:hypothetical protein
LFKPEDKAEKTKTFTQRREGAKIIAKKNSFASSLRLCDLVCAFLVSFGSK